MARFRLIRIEPPDWATQPDLSITGVTVAEHAAIQRHRDKLLRAVNRETEEYLNTPGLYGEGESFPGVDREDDYLGLEVWLKCVPGRWSSFEVFRNTDSSSI
jgi:hypothetical protein